MQSRIESDNDGRRRSGAMVVLGLFGLVAPISTFYLAVSDLGAGTKFLILAALALGYSAVCVWSFQRLRADAELPAVDERATTDVDDLEASLKSMSEATEFLGAWLQPPDLFRLVSTRVGQFFPFSVSALFVASETPDHLHIAQTHGGLGDTLAHTELPVDQGLAGMTWISGEVEMDFDLALERRWMSEEASAYLK